MWLKHWTMECAYQFLKSKRSLIAPNLNFMRQLVEFESELEENGRGGGQRSSTSTRSSDSSYASAVSCCDCDALALTERPCVTCANDLGAAASLRSSVQSLQTPLSHYQTPMEHSCHFFASSPCQTPASSRSCTGDCGAVTHNITAPPKSASAVMRATALVIDTPRPSTAHPALFALPLTTCSHHVFSFDSPVYSSAPHSGSPTHCNSPLLSPG